MNILIVYKHIDFPVRGTLKDHLYSFHTYHKNNRVFYLRLDDYLHLRMKQDKIPEYLKKIDFDVIAFHYSFASGRVAKDNRWQKTITEVEYFKKSKALKILFAQDELYYTNQLNDFINYFDINHIYTVAPESEWRKIYNNVDFKKVKFIKTLTGYIDPKRHERNEIKFDGIKRTIDIGYRARNLPPWYGKHGYRKTEIANVFNKAVISYNLTTNISTKQEDTLYGDDWDSFLYECKYMLGVESGGSVLDRDGSIREKGTKYISEHPNYSFEEIERLFFPALDGNIKLFALSPRNFECAASRTCQVLIEGEYNDILKPDIHYIPISKDFSNIKEVLDKIKKDDLRESIVFAAYNDIIESGNYTYQKFAEDFFNTCRKSIIAMETKKRNKVYYSILLFYNYYSDRLSWKLVKIYLFKQNLNKWKIIDMLKRMKHNNKLVEVFYKIFIRRYLKKVFKIE